MSLKFGLVGKNIDYSFSRGYFSKKFENEGFDYSYENFDLGDIYEFESVIKEKHLRGLNVTIPYKEAIIPYLDSLNKKASKIGADWAAQRIKSLSLSKAIINAFRGNNSNEVITTLIDKFKYPKYGPGMMWETAFRKLEKKKLN